MGLFDADTYSQLEASAEAASDGHDCDVYFLVVDSIGAVSYTHLDVYKRQASICVV